MEPKLRKNLQNISTQKIVDGLRNTAKKLMIFFTKLWNSIIKNEKEIEIPKEWLEPLIETKPKITPVAVEPIIVFEEPKKHKFALSVPFAFGIKRILAFILLVSCLISMYLAIISYPFALIPICPSVFMFLDYLMLTRPKEKKVKWYVLQDMEVDE